MLAVSADPSCDSVCAVVQIYVFFVMCKKKNALSETHRGPSLNILPELRLSIHEGVFFKLFCFRYLLLSS